MKILRNITSNTEVTLYTGEVDDMALMQVDARRRDVLQVIEVVTELRQNGTRRIAGSGIYEPIIVPVETGRTVVREWKHK